MIASASIAGFLLGVWFGYYPLAGYREYRVRGAGRKLAVRMLAQDYVRFIVGLRSASLHKRVARGDFV